MSAPVYGFTRIYSAFWAHTDCPNSLFWMVEPLQNSLGGKMALSSLIPGQSPDENNRPTQAQPPSRHLRLLIQRGTWGGRWSYNYRLEKSHLSSCCFCLFPAITVISGQIGINRPPQVENHLTSVLVWVLSVARPQKENLCRAKGESEEFDDACLVGSLKIFFPIRDSTPNN